MSGNPYLDPETGILRNRLGITDAAELAQAESELTSYRLIELRRTGLPGRYDLAHLQAFHRYIFGDLYDWAGELRSVSICKGDLFCLPQHLGSFAGDVFGKLAQAGHLRGLERAAFIDGLTALLVSWSPSRLHQQGQVIGRGTTLVYVLFPTEQAALKCVYLTIMSLDPTGEGQQRWSNRWKVALNAFDGRLSAACNEDHEISYTVYLMTDPGHGVRGRGEYPEAQVEFGGTGEPSAKTR